MRSDLLLVTEVSTWRGNLYIYVYLSLSLYTWVEILDMGYLLSMDGTISYRDQMGFFGSNRGLVKNLTHGL